MIIKEIIASWLANSSIIEMAMSRRDAESKITNLSDPITEHLIKILRWKDELNTEKHIRDINYWIRSIQRIKLKNWHPTQKDYFTWMFNDVASDLRTLELWIDSLNRYHSLPDRFTDIEVFDYIKAILFKVANDLSTKTFTDIRPYLP